MSIYRRKSGRWAVRIDFDRTVDGRRTRRALGTYATRKEAERAEREALQSKDRGIDLHPDRIDVGTLLDRYVRDRAALAAEQRPWSATGSLFGFISNRTSAIFRLRS